MGEFLEHNAAAAVIAAIPTARTARIVDQVTFQKLQRSYRPLRFKLLQNMHRTIPEDYCSGSKMDRQLRVCINIPENRFKQISNI